jgi:hypothetical protein
MLLHPSFLSPVQRIVARLEMSVSFVRLESEKSVIEDAALSS